MSVIGDSSTDGSTVIVNPVDPTDPTDPVDPTDPTDPTDPVDPGTPGTPGGGSDAAGPGSMVSASAWSPVTDSSAALASTGLDSGFWERLALILLLTGLALLGVRRFALRR